MTPIVRHSFVICASLLPLAAHAQPEPYKVIEVDEPGTFERLDEERLRLSLFTGAAYQFETDLDGGGEVGVVRAGIALAGTRPLDHVSRLRFRAEYDFDHYDFAELEGIEEDPWDDVHTLTLGAIYEARFDETWTAFIGPAVRFAGEGGADLDDSITFGGVVGASYEFSEKLRLGLGLSIFTEIEDNTRVVPFPIVEWRINDVLTLTGSRAQTVPTGAGLELVYHPAGDWRFAVGGGYHRQRFRLDDGDVAPEGAGEESGLPLWLRASHELGPQALLSAYVGLMTGGEIEIEDEGGDGVLNRDYDTTPFVGLALEMTF